MSRRDAVTLAAVFVVSTAAATTLLALTAVPALVVVVGLVVLAFAGGFLFG